MATMGKSLTTRHSMEIFLRWSYLISHLSFARYDKGTLKKFNRSGGFWFLPQSWQIPVADFEADHDNIWYWFLYGTLKHTEANLKKLNVMVFSAYAIALILADLLFFVTKRSNGSLFVRNILRLVLTHGLVLAVGFYSLRTVQESNWGKDIQSYKAYRLPVYFLADEELLPETVPTSSDILIAPHYSSDYLAGYGRVLDYAHRGNQFWKQLTKDYSSGYVALPEGLRHEFCASLMQSVRTDRRVLQQDLARSWIPVDDEEELSSFCRRALLRAENPLIEAMVHQVEALQTEAHYGRFQGSVMMAKAAPKVLEEWENMFIPPMSLTPKMKAVAKKNSFLPRNFAVITDAQEPKSKKQPVPPQPPRKEPYQGAWLQTGDIVEGKLNCKHNGKDDGCMISHANYLIHV
jgi:hypothetical protein